MTAPVITRSGVPSARVAHDCPMDSRADLPPPKTTSFPPAQRSSCTSISRLGSARRVRSPAVGPYDATYSEREILAIETPSAQTPQAAHNTPALDRHELHFHGNAWLEPDGAARKHVQAFAPRLFPVEQIGRASGRERVCQYVSISVVAVSLKKKQPLIKSKSQAKH